MSLLSYRRSERFGLPLTRLQFLRGGRKTIRAKYVAAGGEETRREEAAARAKSRLRADQGHRRCAQIRSRGVAI